MEYAIGTRITFTINKTPPFVHVKVNKSVNREYNPGAKVILNQLIDQVSESIKVPVRVLV